MALGNADIETKRSDSGPSQPAVAWNDGLRFAEEQALGTRSTAGGSCCSDGRRRERRHSATGSVAQTDRLDRPLCNPPGTRRRQLRRRAALHRRRSQARRGDQTAASARCAVGRARQGILCTKPKAPPGLRHPGIVTVLDTGQTDDGRVYIVYEFIRGTTLQSRLEQGNYSLDDVVRWVAGSAEALHHAHKNGIVHRDIKPANILLDEDSQPHIADFGLAKMDDQFFKNDAGRVLGTAAYMSPEQAAGQSHWASPQTDIYSLGVMLYQMLTKRLPFGGRTLSEMLEQVKQRVPSPPRTIDDKIPKPLEDVCLKAMAKNPGRSLFDRRRHGGRSAGGLGGPPPSSRGRWLVGGLSGGGSDGRR